MMIPTFGWTASLFKDIPYAVYSTSLMWILPWGVLLQKDQLASSDGEDQKEKGCVFFSPGTPLSTLIVEPEPIGYMYDYGTSGQM